MTTGNLGYDAQVRQEKALKDRIAWLEMRLRRLADTPADWHDTNFREYARYTIAHETTHGSADDQ